MLQIIYYIYLITQKINSQKIDVNNLQMHLLFKNEVCSYNGYPVIENGVIKCLCHKGYKTRKNFYLTIANKSTDIQCSYKQKKRFTTFFLAVITPFGFDYFYLGKYYIFIIIIIIIAIYIFLEIFFIILKSKLKGDNEFQEYRNGNIHELKYNKKTIIFYEDEINRRKFIYKVLKKIKIVLQSLIGIFWVINIFLQGFGVIKDGNGFETEDDMLLLFEVKSSY